MIWCTHPWERDVSITGTNHGREHTQKSLQPTITLQEKIELLESYFVFGCFNDKPKNITFT